MRWLKVSSGSHHMDHSQVSDSTAPRAQPRQEIHITLKDGNNKTGTSWETTPMDVAKEISKSLSEKLVIAKVDGVLWDLERPLEGSVNLELLDFEHPEGPISRFTLLDPKIEQFRQENRYFGTLVHMYSEKLRRSTMVVICASDLLQKMGSSMIWVHTRSKHCSHQECKGLVKLFPGKWCLPTMETLRLFQRPSSKRSKSSFDWSYPKRRCWKCSRQVLLGPSLSLSC
jgi:TGS domain